jgi:hypothetical protein
MSKPPTNFVELDTLMSGLQSTKPRPRLYHDLFDKYYASDTLAPIRITQTELFERVVPEMCKCIVAAPRTFKSFSLRVLTTNQCTNVTVTRLQAYTLMCCIWFGLLDYDYLSPGASSIDNFAEVTFIHSVHADNINVLHFLLAYFAAPIVDPQRLIILQRFSIKNVAPVDRCGLPIIEPVLGTGNYDDTYAPLQLTSCHKQFGGNMFRGSLTQEEVMLLIRPECILVPLLCERLGEREVVLVYGAEKYSQYYGTGSSVQPGKYKDTTTINRNGPILRTCVVFANPTDKSSAHDQLVADFDRDIIKAYIGMTAYPAKCSIASANWTYGFNGTNVQGKFVQLLIAASLAGKTLEYYTSGDFEKMLIPFISWLQTTRPTVRELYSIYRAIVPTTANSKMADLNVFQLIIEYNDLVG